MALTPQNTDGFIREVDEELRRAQLASFWTRFGVPLIVAVVVALLALGGWLYWQHRQTVAAGERGERFNAALVDLGRGSVPAAEAKLQSLAKDDPGGGYALLAELTLAANALEKGDAKQAVTRYAAVAANKDAPQLLRDVAIIRQTMIEFDTLPPAKVVERMKPYAEPGNPWFGTAGEMTALAWIKLGKPELAGPLLAALAKDEGAPETLRTRATKLASLLGVDAVAEPAAAGKE